MPRAPHFSPGLSAIGGSVFSALAHRLATYRGEIYPLHVGDTWLEPVDGCRMEDLLAADNPDMHRYSPPRGLRLLSEAIAERSQRRTGVATDARDVLVTAGATGGLGAVMGAILEPGDEVLVLAPYWPLILGIVRCFHAEPVIVPIFGEGTTASAIVTRLAQALSPRTAALYVSTPNNPTGRVLPREWLEAIVEFARRERLWVASDEVYEDYVYRGEHVWCRALAPELTFSVHSFSKAFGMAGNRCGYVIGPTSAMDELCKISTHSCYATPTASQLVALRALDGRGDRWIDDVRERYRAVGEAAAVALGLAPPEGGTFLFADASAALDERGLTGFLADCADRGLFLAPGPSFGPFPTHVRLCFTSAPPEVIGRGVAVLAERLARRARY